LISLKLSEINLKWNQQIEWKNQLFEYANRWAIYSNFSGKDEKICHFLWQNHYNLLENPLSLSLSRSHNSTTIRVESLNFLEQLLLGLGTWRKSFGWLGRSIIQVWSFSGFWVLPSSFPGLQVGSCYSWWDSCGIQESWCFLLHILKV